MGRTRLEQNKFEDVVDSLRLNYKKNNPDRLLMLSLLSTMSDTPNINPDLYFSAVVFILKRIEYQYSLTNKLGWSAKKSSFYALLCETLDISDKNPLSDEENLIHLCRFYQYFSTHTAFENHAILLENLKTLLRLMLHPKTNEINAISARLPNCEKLKIEMITISEMYKQQVSSSWMPNYFRNTDRQNQMDLLIQVAFSASDDSERARDVCLGALLAVALHIQQIEYKGAILTSTSGSNLFNLCLKIFNAHSLNAIPSEIEIKCLKSFYTHLFQHADWQKLLPTSKALIHERLAHLEPVEKQTGKIEQYLGHYTGRAVGYGLTLAVTECAAGGMIPTASMLVVAGDTITFSLGLACGGPLGAIVAQQVGRVATAAVLYYVADKIASQVGHTAARAVTITFSNSVDGLKNLLGFARKELNISISDELVEALLMLPPDLLDPETHRKIEYTHASASPSPSSP